MTVPPPTPGTLVARPRVIIFGSREWPDIGAARSYIANRLFELPTDAIIVHGGARGADRVAADEANKLGLYVAPPYLPDYEMYGRKQAPKARNQLMADVGAHLAIGFWNGKSGGTWDMRRRAEAAGIPVEWHDLGAAS